MWLALFLIGRLCYRLGLYGRARRFYERGAERRPGSLRLQYELGRTHLKLGNHAEARRSIGAARGLSRAGARAHYIIGKTLHAMGECDDALPHATRASELRPRGERYRRLADLVGGDLAVYRGGFRPAVVPIAGYAVQPGRILHVLDCSRPHAHNGYAVRSHYVLASQRALGLEPVAVTKPGFPANLGVHDFADTDVVDGVPYHRIAHDGPERSGRVGLDRLLTRYVQGVRDLAARERPELLHAASDFKNGLAADSVARSLGVPWIYEMRGLWEDSAVANGTLAADSEGYRDRRAIETRCLVAAQAVVTLSRTMKDEICGRGVDPDKVFIVANAVETDRFPVVERDARLARQLGLGADPVVGYVGTFTRYEGLDVLVRALAPLRAEIPAARLLLVGSGAAARELGAVVEELGLGDAVLMPGRVSHEDVLRYFSLIDVFVVPRIRSRVCELVTPLKPYEAMSTGRAVVVSDVAALREMIEENVTGVSFRAGDAADLAARCVKLLREPEMRRSLGARAAEWVRRHRTWSAVSRTYLEAYEAARDASREGARARGAS